MTKPIMLSRAVATATAALGACLLASASPAAAFSPTSKTGGENTALSLSPSSTGTHASTSSGGASIVRTVVGLAIVLAVIWGLAWIMRQVKAGRDPSISSAGLASVAALTLGTGRSVHLVRAGNDYVLLGSTEHGVAPIHRYTEEQARDAGLLGSQGLEPEEATTASNSGSLLPAVRPAGAAGGDPMGPSTSIVERMREWTVRR
jgi:flagellar protein FliO/FliZ